MQWLNGSYDDAIAVQKAAELEFPLPLDQMAWTHRAISPPEMGTGLFLAGLSLERCSQYRIALESAGLRLAGVGFNADAQLAGIEMQIGKMESGKVVALLDVGLEDAQITLAAGREILFCRSVSFGEERLNGLVEEIGKTFDYFVKTRGGRKPAAIFIVGDGAVKPAQSETLRDILGPQSDMKVFNVRWMGAFGQAISALAGKSMWFLPPKVSQLRHLDVLTNHRSTILAGIALFFVALGVMVGHINERNKKVLQDDILRLKHVTAVSTNQPAANPEDRTVSLLIEVVKRLPPGVCLVDYNYDTAQKMLSLRGRSVDYGKVSEFTSALSNSKLFQSIHGEKSNLLQLGTNQIVEFSVGALL
jgi:hypothetical protein